VAAYLRREDRTAGVYVARGFARGDAVYGLSDVDLAVIVGDADLPGAARQERMLRRWERLCSRLPLLRGPFEVSVYDEAALDGAIRSSVLTYGLEAANGPQPPAGGFLAVGFGGPEWWVMRRPGLFAPLSDWQLVAGPDRRPRRAPYDAQERRLAAWLELVVWWSYAFLSARGVREHSGPHFSVKLVTEAARTWLWLAGYADRWEPREQVLVTAAARLPEEELSLRRALELHRQPEAAGHDPLPELLPAFARLTARVAERISEELESVPHSSVRLTWSKDDLVLPPSPSERLRALGDGEPRLLPLGDWESLAWPPGRPDETFAVVDLDPGDPRALASAVEASEAGPYAALPIDDAALVVPGRAWGLQRSVQCAATDPVTFAVARGATDALFPDVRGWSARDTAVRAVAEHRTWLETGRRSEDDAPVWPRPPGNRTLEPRTALGRLFTAARAALYLESVEGGAPELPLTIAAVAARLAETAARSLVDETFGAYRTSRLEHTQPPLQTIRAFDELVRALPAYAR
jgi:hypothetical protein